MRCRYQDHQGWHDGDDCGLSMRDVQFDVEHHDGAELVVGRCRVDGEPYWLATAVMPNPMTAKTRLYEGLRVQVAARHPL